MERNTYRGLLVSFVAGVVLLGHASVCDAGAVVAESTFDKSVMADGWTSYSFDSATGVKSAGGVIWTDSTKSPYNGGNPGGFLYFDDANAGAGTTYIQAPSKFLGNYYKSGLESAGEIAFDHKIIASGKGDTYDGRYQIKLVGGANNQDSATWEGPLPTVKNFVTPWVTITAPLIQSEGWTVTSGTWSDLLQDVTQMNILMELVDNNHPGASLTDHEGIDNAILETVPEPGSITLAGVSLAAFGMASLRRWSRRQRVAI